MKGNTLKRMLLCGILFAVGYQYLNAAFKFSGNKATLGLDNANSKLILDENITNFDGILKLRTSAADNITSVSTETITFSGGAVQVGNNVIDLTGCTYDPKNSGNDLITLNDGDVLSVSAGMTILHDVVVASSATAEIVGTPDFASELTVNSSATLKLGIQHKLAQNIVLGASSTLKLTDDLSLKDGVMFTGVGVSGGTVVVDLQKYSLEFGSTVSASPWTGAVTFKRAQDIRLSGPTSLEGKWSFVSDGTDKESILNGNGCVLDLSGGSGGIIEVGLDHTLYISDVHIKGFGANETSFKLADHATTPGRVVLSNVSIDLADNYIHSAGSIKVAGDNVRMIVGSTSGGAPYSFTVDQTASSLSTVKEMFEIDGQVLTYETLGGLNVNPFHKITAGPVTAELTTADVGSNGGIIRGTMTDSIQQDTVIDAVVYDWQTVYLSKHYNLFTNLSSPGTPPTNRIVVENSAAPTSKTVIISGGGYSWQFPIGPTKVLKIASATTVYLEGMTLNDFSLDNVEFADETSILLFSGAIVNLARDTTLPTNSRSLVFAGNNTIKGNRQTVTLNSDAAIVQKYGGVTLTIENLNIKTTHATGLKVDDPDGMIKLRDCNMIIDQAGFNFDQGWLFIDGYCKLLSQVTNAVGGSTLFNLTTPSYLNIDSGATLYVGRGINFAYNIDSSGDSDPRDYYRRRHLLFEDPSSTLYLDGCTFTAVSEPITFAYGNLIIDNKVQLIADSTVGAGFETEIGSAMNVEILAGAAFNLDGNVKYVTSSYPEITPP